MLGARSFHVFTRAHAHTGGAAAPRCCCPMMVRHGLCPRIAFVWCATRKIAEKACKRQLEPLQAALQPGGKAAGAFDSTQARLLALFGAVGLEVPRSRNFGNDHDIIMVRTRLLPFPTLRRNLHPPNADTAGVPSCT